MEKENLLIKDTTDRELVITRILNAPRDLVFRTWTDPKQVAKWWGPNGFTNTIQEMDVRSGGVWRFIMHGPDGTNYKNKIVFIEVLKPERLVYQHVREEETESINFHVTVTFEKQGDKTRLTMRSLFESAAEFERVNKEYGATEGAHQTMDRLEEYLGRM